MGEALRTKEAGGGSVRPAAAESLPSLSDREFRLFQSFIHKEAGIHLADHKRPLLVGRLARRLRELGVGFAEYYQRVAANTDEEAIHLLDCVSTNETHFFREPAQFTFLEDHALPELEALAAAGHVPRRIRVWSAACSTGEEPYSIAMTLRNRFPASSGWELQIVASDISTRVLARAENAVWPIQKATEIPYGHLRRFMLRGTGSQVGKMRAGAEIRDLVSFRRMNLNDPVYSVTGEFDLIFCRNVLIYFDAVGRKRVVSRLLDMLAPHGHFFLGHAETLAGIVDRVESVIPNVYRLKPQRAADTGR